MKSMQLWIGAALFSAAQLAAASEPPHKPGDCPFLRPMLKCPPKLTLEPPAAKRAND